MNHYGVPVPRDAEATFLFADIAGFTALTEAHGDEQAVQLVEEFASAVQAELPRVDGEYVKAVGDALMLRVPDPGDAVRLGLWITRSAMSGHQALSVRVGGNYGSAVERGGDYFGSTINVAGRVSALAGGGELLVTGRTAALATDIAPHWVGGLIDWGSVRVTAAAVGGWQCEVGAFYATFLRNLLSWTGQLEQIED